MLCIALDREYHINATRRLTGSKYKVDVCELQRHLEHSCVKGSCVTSLMNVTLQCTAAVVSVTNVINTSSVNVTITIERCHVTGTTLYSSLKKFSKGKATRGVATKTPKMISHLTR